MRMINKCCTRLLLHKEINITRVINTFSQKKKINPNTTINNLTDQTKLIQCNNSQVPFVRTGCHRTASNSPQSFAEFSEYDPLNF